MLLVVFGSLMLVCPLFMSCTYDFCGCNRELYYYTLGVCFNANTELNPVPEYFIIFFLLVYGFYVLCVRLAEAGGEVWELTTFYIENQMIGLIFCVLFLMESLCRCDTFLRKTGGMSCRVCGELVDWVDFLLILSFVVLFILGMPQVGVINFQPLEMILFRIPLRILKIVTIVYRSSQ